jgi:tripartite-type tricarboxylate transporter receptor subunit TctC
MLLTSGNFTALPAFTRTLPYDPVRDFAPISSIARIPGFLLAVHPSLPVRSVKDLVALARANPAKLNYGSSGTGGVQHLAMALFNLATDTKMTHVLYKGAPPLSIDLMSGQIETAFVVPAGALEFVRTGRMRAIGFSGKKRWNRLPEVPTIEEAGVKGYEYFTWYGFWYPAAVAADAIGRVHAEIAKTVASPEVSRRFDDLGFEGFVSDKPADFARFVQADLAAMKKLATQIGAVPE